MGVREDVAAWIAYYIVKPALDAFNKHASAIEKTWALVISGRLRIFLQWIVSLDTSLSAWVKKEIAATIDLFVDGYGDAVDTLISEVEAVTEQIGTILEHVQKFASNVITITINWWTVERERMLKVMRETYVRILEFEREAIKVILDWWTDTWTMVVNHVKAGIEELGLKLDIDIDDILKQLNSTRDTVLTRITEQITIVVASIDTQIENVKKWFESMDRATKAWMETEIDKVIELYRKEVPNIVEGLFMWAKPIVEPVIDAGVDLKFIVDAMREETPLPPEWKRVMDENNSILEEVKTRLLGKSE